jgi:AraC family transcriptional regulator, transcriptional activator of pobA
MVSAGTRLGGPVALLATDSTHVSTLRTFPGCSGASPYQVWGRHYPASLGPRLPRANPNSRGRGRRERGRFWRNGVLARFRVHVCAQGNLSSSFLSPVEHVSNKPLKIPLFRLASGRTQVDDRLGISLQRLVQRVPFRHIPHRHDFYHVAWIEAGTGTFIQDDKSYPIKPGSLIFVPPGQVHTWEAKEALHGYILSFEPTLLFSQTERPYRLLHELTQWSATARRQIEVSDRAHDLLGTKFEDLAGEFCTSEEFRDEMLRTQITSILISLHRLSRDPDQVEATDDFHPLTSRFLALLEKEEGKFYRANHYVSVLSVDSRAFVNAVLSETGKSPSVWIRDRTLLEARRLLSYTDLTISEIAYRLNFRNVSYFVRFYRRLTGISPGAARAKSVKS